MNGIPNAVPPRGYTLRVLALVGVGLAAAAGLFLTQPPIPQPLAYHAFEDQRPFLGVPHFLNVVSNVPFLAVGAWGLWFLLRGDPRQLRRAFEEPAERWPYAMVFLGLFLTGFGSAYYHLDPNNGRLVWDRLPMTIAFMGVLAGVLGDRLGPKVGIALLGPLLIAGIGSVLYWHATEQQGNGDLRPYIFVQAFPIAIVFLLPLLFPPRYTRTFDLFIAAGWYLLAKLCEAQDGWIFHLGYVVSGHTLKHLLGGVGTYWILRMLQRRQPVHDAKQD